MTNTDRFAGWAVHYRKWTRIILPSMCRMSFEAFAIKCLNSRRRRRLPANRTAPTHTIHPLPSFGHPRHVTCLQNPAWSQSSGTLFLCSNAGSPLTAAWAGLVSKPTCSVKPTTRTITPPKSFLDGGNKLIMTEPSAGRLLVATGQVERTALLQNASRVYERLNFMRVRLI